VKNLIDWLSRPVVAGDYDSTAIAGMSATVSGCAGRSGSRTMQAQLVRLLQSVRVQVLDKPTVGVVIPAESWMTDVLTLGDDTHAEIREQIDAFLKMPDE
jgi:NAD(P)H-dependent FMN reductase